MTQSAEDVVEQAVTPALLAPPSVALSLAETPAALPQAVESTAMHVLFVLSCSHMLNDTLQSLIPAIYPVLKQSFHLDYSRLV